MKIKRYLNDVIDSKKHILEYGKINLITVPCGCGKTTYFFETLLKQYDKSKILYIVDTNMLEESMLAENKNILQGYDKYYLVELRQKIFNNNTSNISIDKVTVMSFQRLGTLLNDDLLDFLFSYIKKHII